MGAVKLSPSTFASSPWGIDAHRGSLAGLLEIPVRSTRGAVPSRPILTRWDPESVRVPALLSKKGHGTFVESRHHEAASADFSLRLAGGACGADVLPTRDFEAARHRLVQLLNKPGQSKQLRAITAGPKPLSAVSAPGIIGSVGWLEYTHWHLTPRGWERGTRKHDNDSQVLPDPPGSVGVWIWSDDMPSPVGMSPKYELEKGRQTGSDAEVEALIKKFGECPRRL